MWRESDDETNYGKFKRWLQRGEALRKSPNHMLIFGVVEIHIICFLHEKSLEQHRIAARDMTARLAG